MHHVAVFVRDLKRALHLFQDILELEMIWHAPVVKGKRMDALLGVPNVQMEMAYLKSRFSETAVELCRMMNLGEEAKPSFGSPGTASLSLQVQNLDQMHRRLTKEGWKPISDPLEMRDPEGNPVRLFCFRADEGLTLELLEISASEYP